jgi:probable rRNA maturation factor
MVYYPHDMETFSITSFVASFPNFPYQQMKDDILGKKYELSLTFVGATRAQTLNREHRKKEYVPNVLSFPLDSNIGEIFITPAVAKKEAHKFNLSVDGYIGYLFIHALLHLKGLDHGDTMDKAEKKYCLKYKLK